MKNFNKNKIVIISVISLVFCLAGPVAALAATAPTLGAASPFAVLAASAVTCTGATAINGEVGVSTGTSIGGFPVPCIVASPGITHSNDSSAIAGQAAILTAYGQLAGQPVGTALNLAVNNTVPPGIYEVGAADLSGSTLTLNGPGVYIFRSSSSLTDAAGGSTVTLNGGATAANVFWQIPTSMSIGTGTQMVGTIIADTGAITIATGATLNGRALTKGTLISMDANTIIVPTELHLRKIVVGGAALSSAWTLTAIGTGGSPTNLSGTTPVDSDATFKADTYTLAESAGPLGYTASSWSCVTNGGAPVTGASITLASGDIATCTITNTFSAPGPVAGTCGTAAKSYLSTDVAFSGTMCDLGNGITTPASPTFPAAGNSVTWTCGGSNGGASSSTCTAIRAAVLPATATLTLVKTIVGGTRPLADFPLTATGPIPAITGTITGVSATPAVTTAVVPAGTYALSETTHSNYAAGTWSCIKNATLPAVVGASITLASGDSAICTIQNTYITSGGGVSFVPPLIDIVKVPSPLALPAGPGPVIYTYTVRNVGVVPMTDIAVVDNTCSPMKYISGDTNNDLKLDVNETWTYTCSMTLPATTTNTVTATGWSNGISATAIANATVVVGASIVPPLIHVTKVPNPLALSAGGGMVTYIEKITNPGIVALSNVHLTDDKCSSVIYASGDINNDSKLDPTETWTYSCQTNITQTTTNTAVATGQANGITATGFAIATVVVAAPALPNTGLPPKGYNPLWVIAILDAVLMLVSTSIVVILKKREI